VVELVEQGVKQLGEIPTSRRSSVGAIIKRRADEATAKAEAEAKKAEAKAKKKAAAAKKRKAEAEAEKKAVADALAEDKRKGGESKDASKK
jgi:penicillin-binding protein